MATTGTGFLFIRKLIRVFAGLLFAVIACLALWFVFAPVGPAAAAFCDAHPVGSNFDRASAVRELNSIGGGYSPRIDFHAGSISLGRNGILLQQNNMPHRRLTLEELLALTPFEGESFAVTSLGLTKRTCVLRADQNKVSESKSHTWN